MILFVLALLVPGTASCQAVKGYLEFSYSTFDTTSTDAAGESTETESNAFNQIYNLSIKRAVYPNLTLNASGLFEKNSLDTTIDGQEADFTTTSIRPFIDLTLRSQLLTAGVNYNRRQEKQTGTELAEATNINEEYRTIFSWKPEGFPHVSLRYSKTNTFDKARILRDISSDTLLVNMRYEPAKGIDLEYQPNYKKTDNKLDNIETTSVTHTGRFTYSERFMEKRLSLFSRYNISHNSTETIVTGGTGQVAFQLFPFSGLSSIDDTPEEGPLNLNTSLIDGATATSSGINVGLPSLGGDSDPRNIGVDFVNETEVNTIFVWVDRDLPAQIANAFTWEIYTSPDNDDWTLFATVPFASFGPFQNRFEIEFPNVSARYIKVVTTPLEPVDTVGVPGNFDNIFVTEIQAFIRRPADEVGGRKTTRTSHLLNFDAKYRIAKTPALFYEFSYFYTRTDPAAVQTYTLSNGLSLTQRLSDVFTVSARAAREDSEEQNEKGVTYRYNASLIAVPLRTLKHTLTYSGSLEEFEGITTERNSLFLRNSAELYRGINVNLSGGLSVQEADTGEESTNTIVNIGSDFVPHRTLTITLNFSSSRTEETDSEGEESTTSNRKETMRVAYRPFHTLYLFVSLESITRTERTRNIQNYGVTWSPFPDGSLQFNFAYNETITADEGETRLISPSVRWNISRNSYLDLAYQDIQSEEESRSTDSSVSSATLRILF